MSEIKVMPCDQELLRALGVPASADNLLIAAHHREIEPHRRALERIAEQRLSNEMRRHKYASADFEEGYEECVRIARRALGLKT